jgi:hypothetical protein
MAKSHPDFVVCSILLQLGACDLLGGLSQD